MDHFRTALKLALIAALGIGFSSRSSAEESARTGEREREAVATVEESVGAEEEEGDIFKETERRWRLNFSYTARWDDNVTLEPDRLHVSDNEADWYHILTFGANARILNEGGHMLTAGYSLYQSFYDRHDGLGLHGSTASLVYTYKRAPVVAIIPFSYSFFLLDGHRYLHFPQFQPTLIWQQYEKFVGVFQVTYRGLNFIRNYPVNGFVDDDRSADQFTLGYEQWWLIQPDKNHRLQGGFDWIYESTQDPIWSYRGWRLHVEYKLPLPWRLQTEFGFAWEPRQYLHPNPNFTHRGGIPQTQTDNRYSYSATIQRPFELWKLKLAVGLNYRYIDNKSDVKAEDYSKHYIGLTLSGSF